jgi:orotate phosphoribosyltransferase
LGNGRKKELKELIKKSGIVFKHVTLSAGKPSDYYYDLKKIAFNPKGLHLLGDLLLEEVTKYQAKSVGGLEMGAVPLSTAVIMKSNLKEFFIRKNPKTHGLEKKVEGHVVLPAVIIDDVLTTGNSIMQAINALRDEGFSVAGVVCVIDREEGEHLDELKKQMKVSTLFRHSDFKDFIDAELMRRKKTEPESSI